MDFINLKEVLDACKVDSDCEYLHFCNTKFLCEHNDLWPVHFLDIIGISFFFF